MLTRLFAARPVRRQATSVVHTSIVSLEQRTLLSAAAIYPQQVETSASQVSPSATADASGAWEVSVVENPWLVGLNLDQNGTTVTGTYLANDGGPVEQPINGTVKGKKVTLVAEDGFFIFDLVVKVKNNSMKGKLIDPNGTKFKLQGTRTPN